MKTSLVVTFMNEEKTILAFLESLLRQSQIPDEVVLIDGGSTDNTAGIVTSFNNKHHKKIRFVFKHKKGNRSVGRNEAVGLASHEIIVCSDVGCVLDENWVKEITKPFKEKSVDVVAGYYVARATNVFQKALTPFALVMPDQVDPENFLPATRSIAFKKSAWERVGGFDEKYSHNEDYVFARSLREAGLTIVFAKDAIVYWIPRNTFKQAFIMMFRFALGDMEAGIYRGKVLLLFTRYILACYFLLLSYLYRSPVPLVILGVGGILYLLWSIVKNYRYVKDPQAFFLLPASQLTADAAVMSGSLLGVFKRLKQTVIPTIKRNKLLILLISIYSCLMISVIRWGLPGQDHPFIYHMDEWHQLPAVRFTITHGNPNQPGAAYGPLLQFLLSGLFLGPFTLLRIINPFIITSSFAYLDMQMRIFEVLRINTLLWGITSLVGIYTIAKRYLAGNGIVAALLFLFTPIYLSLSNYFKYDIALLAWIVWGLYANFSFAKKPTVQRFTITGIIFGLALSTKISALPLIPLYLVSYLLFVEKRNWTWKLPLIGSIALVMTFFLFGIPNVFFGQGDYREFLYSNLILTPASTDNYILGMHYLGYLFLHQLPFLFGYPLAVLCVLSAGYLMIRIRLQFFKKKAFEFQKEAFLIIGFLLFLFSLYPLKIIGTGNRALVLLPFMVLLSSLLFKKLQIRNKSLITGILAIVLGLQIIQCIPWMTMKWSPDPRSVSSTWMERNIPPGVRIGVELIPIYQYLPNIALKEYYLQEEHQRTRYDYEVIDAKSSVLPEIVIVSNGDFDENYLMASLKKDLLNRLRKEQYKKVAEFYPDGILVDQLINRRDFYIANLGPVAPIPEIAIYRKD